MGHIFQKDADLQLLATGLVRIILIVKCWGPLVLPMITMVLNTDGVEHVKSSPQSPVLVAVNELPSKQQSELLIAPFMFVKTEIK